MLATTQEANEYRQKFHQYYSERIVNNLASFESLRKTELKRWITAITLMLITAILAIWIVFKFSTGRGSPGDAVGRVFLFGAMGLGFWAHNISKNFENKIKKAIMYSFLSFFGDFSWHPSMRISKSEIDKTKLVGSFENIEPNDYFQGTHKGLKICFSDCILSSGSKYSNNYKKVFDGLFIQLEMNKSFGSHTILLEHNHITLTTNLSLPHKFPNMENVALEDPEFNKMFHVFTQNQVEARYILTTAFMERIKHLKDTFKTNHIRASFLDDSVLIAMDSSREWFKLGDLRKPVDDVGEFQEFFEEFVAVLSLVELLHLDSKTGM